jgi:hypothetical protein
MGIGTTSYGLGPFYDAQREMRHGEIWRRIKLKVFAQSMADSARKGTITDLEGFARVAYQASIPFRKAGVEKYDDDFQCREYLEDLRRVLIGDGLRSSERNHGRFALGFNAFRDTGFKPEYQDGGNQVQHAMAGIYISHEYSVYGRQLALYLEKEAPDLALYAVTFQIGIDIDGSNFTLLSTIIRNRIGA